MRCVTDVILPVMEGVLGLPLFVRHATDVIVVVMESVLGLPLFVRCATDILVPLMESVLGLPFFCLTCDRCHVLHEIRLATKLYVPYFVIAMWVFWCCMQITSLHADCRVGVLVPHTLFSILITMWVF